MNYQIFTLIMISFLLASCATTTPSGKQDAGPRDIVKKAIKHEQPKLDNCFAGPSAKDEYFVGKLVYAIEFNNRHVTSIKFLDSTFQNDNKSFKSCVEDVIKGLELDEQPNNLPYNIQYPFEFGMDRE